jgi:predicted RNA-binding protein with PUA domain
MKLLGLFTAFLILFSTVKADINIQDLEKQLNTSGLTGEIHGSSADAHLFVLTYRNPNNFFENIQLPLTSEKTDILNSLPSLKRHQFYLVKGNFIKNKAPISHINITSLDLVKDYTSALDHMPYQYKGNLEDLRNKKDFIGRVHAIGQDGKMLVTEYKDRIVPIYVVEPSSQDLVKKLYRGDLVKIRFTIRTDPEAPIHLSLARVASLPADQKPVELIDSLVKAHGSSVEKTGSLIMFPKSPQINTNIYALLVEDPEGTTIQYTLANLEDPELFKQIRAKLEKIWNDNNTTIENDRNKFVNRKLKVTAKGISNMIDPGQANPQILINSVNDVNVTVL